MPDPCYQRRQCYGPAVQPIVVSPRCAELRLPSAPPPLDERQPDWMTVARAESAPGQGANDSTLLISIPAGAHPSFVYCGTTQSTTSSDGRATVLRSYNGISFDGSTTAGQDPFIRVEKVGDPVNGAQQYRVTFLQPTSAHADLSGGLDRDALVLRVDGRDYRVRPAAPVAPQIPPAVTEPVPSDQPRPGGPELAPAPLPAPSPPIAPAPRGVVPANSAATELPEPVLAVIDPRNRPTFVPVPEGLNARLNAAVARAPDSEARWQVHNSPAALHAMQVQKVNDGLYIITTHHTVTNPAGGLPGVDTAIIRRTGSGWEIAGVDGRGATAIPIPAERMTAGLNGAAGAADWPTRFGWLSDPNMPMSSSSPALAPTTYSDFPVDAINANGPGARLFHPAVQPRFIDVPRTTPDNRPSGLNEKLDAIAERTRGNGGVWYLSDDHPGARHTMRVERVNDNMLVISTFHTPTAPGSLQLVDTAIFMRTPQGWQVASVEGRGTAAQPTTDGDARRNLSLPYGEGRWATRLAWLSDRARTLTTTSPDLTPPVLPRP